MKGGPDKAGEPIIGPKNSVGLRGRVMLAPHIKQPSHGHWCADGDRRGICAYHEQRPSGVKGLPSRAGPDSRQSVAAPDEFRIAATDRPQADEHPRASGRQAPVRIESQGDPRLASRLAFRTSRTGL